MMMILAFISLMLVCMVASQSVVTLQDQPFGDDLWVRDFKVPTSDDASLSIFVRNKYRRVTPTAGVGRANRTLIFIAGGMRRPARVRARLSNDWRLFDSNISNINRVRFDAWWHELDGLSCSQ